MTYPDARYYEHDGQISAVYRPASQAPDLQIGSDNVVHYLATGASTSGEFGLYRWELGPRAAGPSEHFHRTISESFFILSGTLRIFDGARWIDATAGDFVYVPAGGVHAFRNESGQPVSMLLLFAPGAPREAYFETLADLAAGRQLSRDEWIDFCIRHDSYFLEHQTR